MVRTRWFEIIALCSYKCNLCTFLCQKGQTVWLRDQTKFFHNFRRFKEDNRCYNFCTNRTYEDTSEQLNEQVKIYTSKYLRRGIVGASKIILVPKYRTVRTSNWPGNKGVAFLTLIFLNTIIF